MKRLTLPALALLSLQLAGCATITGDTAQSIRVETVALDGTEVSNAECELANEYGSYRLKTPGQVMVRRSSSDLNVTCRKEGLPDAQARAVSRANGGMFGNIIFGGGIGAIIDHSKGTGYSYPAWMRLVFGKILAFDRSDDKDGQPSLGREINARPSAQKDDTGSSPNVAAR
jgi:hypothetical protein